MSDCTELNNKLDDIINQLEISGYVKATKKGLTLTVVELKRKIDAAVIERVKVLENKYK